MEICLSSCLSKLSPSKCDKDSWSLVWRYRHQLQQGIHAGIQDLDSGLPHSFSLEHACGRRCLRRAASITVEYYHHQTDLGTQALGKPLELASRMWNQPGCNASFSLPQITFLRATSD